MDILFGLLLYNLILIVAFLLGWPYLLLACLAPGGRKWRQRCGSAPVVEGRPVWLHASSMGEVGLVPPILAALKKKAVITTMTGTGQDRALRFGSGSAVFYLPLDFLPAVLWALVRVRPSALVLMETELWPNLIWLCHMQGIPVFIANARLSDRSLPWYRFFGFLFRPALNRVTCIACQSGQDAERYSSLGVDPRRIIEAGNIKYDVMRQPIGKEEKHKLRSDFGFKPDDLILVAGSTRDGEEEILLDAFSGLIGRMKLVVAPRHPDRFSVVAGLLTGRGIAFSLRSQKKDGGHSSDVLLLDTMGELLNAYAAGDIAFVGGSLVPVGGHNPLEPAALGLPVIFGPHMFNARESAHSLVSAKGAVQVSDARQLRAVLEDFCSDLSRIGIWGTRALGVVEGKRGAAGRISEIILAHLK